MNLKNKKGFLLADETVKIIIALICIGFLVYFLSMLYFSKTDDKKKGEAESALERIDDILRAIPTGTSEIQSIGSPRGWHLYSFISETKPNSCVGENCLCICDSVIDFQETFDRQIKECDKDGACLQIRTLIGEENLDLKIMGDNNLVFVEISKTNEGFSVRQVR